MPLDSNLVGTFYPKSEGRTYLVKEGNLTVNSGYSTMNGKRQDFLAFANEVTQEDFVKFSTEEMTVEKVTAGDKAIGITMYPPEWQRGAIPTAAAADGTYKRRRVTVFRLLPGEHKFPLDENAAAIKMGDSLQIDPTTMKLIKSTAATNVTALQDKAAKAGNYILVSLEGSTVPVKSA